MTCMITTVKNSSLISRIFFINVDNLPPDQLFVKLMSAQDYDIIKPVVQFISAAYTILDNVKWLRCMLCMLRWTSLTYL